MGLSLEQRFERYCDGIVSTLLHADREQPARWYIKGLMLPGERKSVEPMAARATAAGALGASVHASPGSGRAVERRSDVVGGGRAGTAEAD
jgi:SRSO17 transposase